MTATLASFFFLTSALHGQEFEQKFTLQPGWNSVFLDVEPLENDIRRVLRDLPVEVVLRSADTDSSVDYIRDPDEGGTAGPVWLRYQSGKSDATLFSLQAHTAYLMRVGGDAPVELAIRGRPVLEQKAWRPNSWNLRGFAVDPDRPPTFAEFFQTAAQHDPEKIRRLTSDGTWTELTDQDQRMRWGEAYLVYSTGASTFSGPVELLTSTGNGLNFDSSRLYASLQVRSRWKQATAISISDTASDESLLVVRSNTAQNQEHVESLRAPATRVSEGDDTISVQLGVQRAAMKTASYGTVLEIRDQRGTRHLVPVTAKRSYVDSDGPNGPGSYAGLWVGVISVNAVQEVQAGVFDAGTTLLGGNADRPASGEVRFIDAQSGRVHRLAFRARRNAGTLNGLRIRIRENRNLKGDVAVVRGDDREVRIEICRDATTIGTLIDTFNGSADVNENYEAIAASGGAEAGVITDELSPVSRPFELRILIHVNREGQARLLREAFQMWKDGRELVDRRTRETFVDPDNPGRFVLITDRKLLNRYSGATLRAGKPVGRRISAVGFDFAGPHLNATEGHLQPGQTVRFNIELKPKHTTNPFFHRYHPDHKNNVMQILRAISLSVLRAPRDGAIQPDYGYSTLDADWQETVDGLHRASLTVSGNVALRRLAFIDELE